MLLLLLVTAVLPAGHRVPSTPRHPLGQELRRPDHLSHFGRQHLQIGRLDPSKENDAQIVDARRTP
jgi:hypothetical protein